ncbi:Serine/threonine-protein kinase gad8 [Bienertia sinuspersici]
MRVIPFWTIHLLLLVILLFGFTSCDFVDEEESETENEALGTPNYDRLDEIKKPCSSVISSASELKIDDNLINRIKDDLFFDNGDWKQEEASAPLLPFDDRPTSMSSSFEFDLYNSSHLKSPYKLVSFRLTDVSMAHRSKRTIAVNGYLYLVITSELPLATILDEKVPEFSMRRGRSHLFIHLQGIYAESKKNGGERKLCLLGSTMLPSRQPDSDDPGELIRASESGDNLPTLLQDEQILFILNIPKKASLNNRAIQGELRSLNSKTSLKYFDKVQITSQLKVNARDYEFSPDEIISKACNPYPYSDTTINGDIEVYKGADFCTAFEKASIDTAFIVAPHWKCNGTDEFCSKFGPFASDKEINATDGGFNNVRILVNNILCVTKKSQNGVMAKVSAVFRAFDVPNNQFIESQRSGLGNMTLVAEGIWNSSSGQLCMIACLGVLGVEGDHCNSRICLYIPLLFSIKQRSILLGSISSIEKTSPPYFPLSLEMLYQSLDYIYDSYKDKQPYYQYSKIDAAGAILEKYEPFSFGTVVKKSLLTFPKLQDSDDYSDSLRLLAEDLTLHVSAVSDPIPSSHPSGTNIEMEVLSLGPMFGREWFSNDSKASVTSPYHTKASYTEKQLLLNVSTQLKLGGGPYGNFSMLFLEGIYDQHVGRMYLVGCRDVRASWKVLYESMDLENGFDCLIEVVIAYPPTTAQWLVTPTASISISSKRTEDDALYFKPVKLLTLPILYRQQRVDILSRSGFEGILKILTLSVAIACILSQLYYTKHALDSLPYMSLVMLGSQVIGYALPLVIGVQTLSRNNNLEDSESSSYDLERSQWIKVIDYVVKLLVLACLVLTLRLCQKVWSSRVTILSQNPVEPHRAPTEKRVLAITVIIHILGYIAALLSHSLKTGQTPVWIEQYVDATGNSHTLKTWETLFQEYIGLLQDLFLLPQVIGNIIWQINNKPLRKLYYMGITALRLLPHVYDYIRGPVSNPFFSDEYEFVNPRFDFYSEFGDIAIPVLAIGLAVLVYIQQRWNYEQLRNTCICISFRSRMYERLPTQLVEAELVSGTNKRDDEVKSDDTIR